MPTVNLISCKIILKKVVEREKILGKTSKDQFSVNYQLFLDKLGKKLLLYLSEKI